MRRPRSPSGAGRARTDNDAFTISARSRAVDVPASAGAYRALLTIVHTDGSTQKTNLTFDPGTHAFQLEQVSITALADYERLRVRVEHGRASGKAFFDQVSVVKESTL